MNKVILADNQTVFQLGMERIIALDYDFRIIAKCHASECLFRKIEVFPGCLVIFAASLGIDVNMFIGRLSIAGSHSIAILENNDSPQGFLAAGVNGAFHRNITGPALLECMHSVAEGEQVYRPATSAGNPVDEDTVGTLARKRLTPREMEIVALNLQGCKTKEIASLLQIPEQTVTNYLRSIFDKTEVSDRLELALFTIHHKALLEAATAAAGKFDNNVPIRFDRRLSKRNWKNAEVRPKGRTFKPTPNIAPKMG